MNEFPVSRKRVLLPVLSLLIFFIHFAAGYYMWKNHPYAYMHNDGGCYLDLAKTIYEKGVFGVPERIYYEAPRTELVPDAFRLPLLPLLTILFFPFTGSNVFAAVFLQAFLSLALSLIFYAMGKKIFPESSLFPFLLLILVNLHPLVQNFTLCYSSELLFMVTLSAFFYFIFLRESKKKYVLLAVAFAAGAYTRSAILPLAALFPFFLLLFPFGAEEKKANLFSWKRWTKPILFGCTAAVLLLPWCFRNYILFDKFTPSTALGGFNIYIGNSRANLNAYRNSSEFLKEQTVAWKKVLEIADNSPEEFVRKPFLLDAKYNEEAKKEYLQMSVKDRLELLAHKALHFVRPWPNNPKEGGYNIYLYLILAVGESIFFLFSIAGFFLMWKKGGISERNYNTAFLAVFLSGFFLHLIVQVHFRYRIPFMDLGFFVPFLYCFYIYRNRKNLPSGKEEKI